jgi:outer membrane receptor protein involved in Fe transport
VGDVNCADDPGLVPSAFGAPWICGYDYHPFYPIQFEENRNLFFSNVTWDFTDSIQGFAEVSYASTFASRLESAFPWSTFNPILPTYNPGLVEDARRRGIPDGTPLSELRFKGRMGTGVPGLQQYWYDEASGELRPWSKEFGGNSTDLNTTRLAFGLSGDIANTETWTWDVSYTWQYAEGYYTNHDNLKSNIGFALEGLGGAFCDREDPANIANALAGTSNSAGLGCFFYNPMGSSQYDASGNLATTSDLANHPELLEWIDALIITRTEDRFIVVDAVTTGDIFEFNGNTVGLAIGAQYRYHEQQGIRDNDRLDFNYAFTAGDVDYDSNRTIYSLFSEIALPLTDDIDLQVAARYETYEDESRDNVDPKVAIVWRALDSLAFRASYSTSFRAPTLEESDPGRVDVVLSNVVDFDGSTAFVPVNTTGSSGLDNATATNWNIGMSWRPDSGIFEGFTADLDWYNVDYEDLIVKQPYQAIVDADPFDDRIIRDPIGAITSINPLYVNADSVVVSGLDFSVGYRYFTDNWGSWSINLVGNYLNEFDLDVVDPITDEVVAVDGAGWRNHDNPLGPQPELKVNTTMRWNINRHQVQAIVRYIDGFKNSGGGNSGIHGALANYGYKCATSTSGTGCEIDSHTTLDLMYQYEMPPFWGIENDSVLQLGVINATDEDPPIVNKENGIESQVHDPRGRLYYLRYTIPLF